MNIFEQFRGKTVFIYGAGVYGKWIWEKMYQHNIPVKDFFDIKVTNILGLPVYKADEYTGEKEGVVIVAVVKPYEERQQIFQFIRDCGFKEIIDAQSIRCHSVYYDEDAVGTPPQGLSLFRDKHSREIFIANMTAHQYREYKNCKESIGSVQYFPDDIPMDYSRVIDCGGYTGDTATQFIEKGAKKIAVFEPLKEDFMKMVENLDKYRNTELYLFPLAVGSKEIFGDVIAIDEVLKNFAPTFIKMDIEGDEFRAIEGAENTIKRYKPDLAICVYHRINHLWDIPLLLNSWNSGYEFYLKCHNSYTMETVLYATT